MQLVLGACGIHTPAVTRVELQPVGAGNASDTRRVLISYDAEAIDAPESLICKFHPNTEAQRLGMAADGTFAREIGSYRAIGERNACQVPTPYLLGNDGGYFNLVMEDLSRVAALGDQIAGCSVAEAEAVIVEMAKLHGAFADLGETHALDWLMRMPSMGDTFADGILAGAALAGERFGEQLTGQQYASIGQCAELASAWYHLPWSHLTLTHGDPRVDNVLFDKRCPTVAAVIIDWQLTGLRNPMYDVAYFLSSSLSVADRRQHEKVLLARYLDTLGESMPDYREADAVADYRLSMIASLTLNILSTAVLPRTPSVDTLIQTLLVRSITATDDWDSLAAIRNVA